MGRKQRLVREIAEEIIRCSDVDLDALRDHLSYLPQHLYEVLGHQVWTKVRRLRPETLGRIVACGSGRRVNSEGIPIPGQQPVETEMYHVHCASWLGKYNDGMSLLREIARTVIIAEVSDIIYPKIGTLQQNDGVAA